MAGSSFTEGDSHSYCANLGSVNRRLLWNPHPRDRGKAMQELWWDWKDGDTPSESFLRYRKEHALEISMRCTEGYARLLANYPAGRTILDAEDPGDYAFDPSFWWARAEFYRLEQEKLQEEEYNRASMSVTPEVVNPNMPYMTELDRAKCTAGNVARMLASFPAGKALLEAENHGNPMKDGDYWWRFENWDSENSETPPPEADDHGDTITDPGYWWRKSESYSAQLEAEREKTNLERAKRSANLEARDLATFPAGKALLDAEDHGDSAKDPEYWWNKKSYYAAETRKQIKDFWERWKRTRLDGGEAPVESLEQGESPAEALNASRPKTRARKSSALRERRSARVTRRTIERGNETDRPTASRQTLTRASTKQKTHAL